MRIGREWYAGKILHEPLKSLHGKLVLAVQEIVVGQVEGGRCGSSLRAAWSNGFFKHHLNVLIGFCHFSGKGRELTWS